MRRISIVMLLIVGALCGGPTNVRAQAEHKSIHQVESELHRWDALKLDRRVPEFARGREYAINGDFRRAVAAFTRGAKANRAAAEFNIGLVYFNQQKYSQALRFFQQSERRRRDSATHDYLQSSKRLLKARSRQRMK